MNNIRIRLNDIEMSTKTFGRRAAKEFGATPSDVYHLLRFGYTKKTADTREYHWVLEILEIGGEELESYGTHRTTNK
ncbi:MAG: hypothetical protein ACRC1D_03635 [Culicoidibacterales bacterium]